MGNDTDTGTYFKANRSHWDAMTAVNFQSDFYDVPGFLKGRSSLRPIELEALGELVKGKRLLHLHCHFGQDTLSWARMGAQVTGIDLSPAAIDKARELAEETGLSAEFICCNVYDLAEYLEGDYDIVFASYGVIGWVPDVARWVRVGAQFLKPGGTMYLAEFHPYIWMFDGQFKEIQYAYFNRGVISEPSAHSYADPETALGAELMQHGWNHPLSDVTQAFLAAGLRITNLEEFDYSPWPCFPGLREDQPGEWVFEHFGRKIPYVYAISATR